MHPFDVFILGFITEIIYEWINLQRPSVPRGTLLLTFLFIAIGRFSLTVWHTPLSLSLWKKESAARVWHPLKIVSFLDLLHKKCVIF